MINVPFFSVIIPSLNEERYINKILKSLENQTFREFEVILVDGKSDDKTVAIFKKYEEKFPSGKILISDKRNVSYQRNRGAKYANGKYVVFLDADVDISITFLEEIHLSAIKKKFKLATTYILPDSQKQTDLLLVELSNMGQEMAKIINKPFLGEYNAIVEREAFLKLKGFREDVTMSEGHDLAIRALKNNIETVILAEPKVILSLRRFRSEGTLSVLRRISKSFIYTLVKGPITHKMFEYNMGGQAHNKRRKKIDLTKINTYIKAINRLESKINKLLGD